MRLNRLSKIVATAGMGALLVGFALISPATASALRAAVQPGPSRTPTPEQQPPLGIEAPLGRYSEPFLSLEEEVSSAPSVQSGALAPGLGTNFDGIGREIGFIPPDTNAATGPDRIVEVTNTHVGIYDKSGSLIAGGDSGAGAVLLDTFCGQSGCFDPKVIYDQESDRFVAVVLEGSSSSDTWLHVIVSKTSSPGNLTTDWDRFRQSVATTISSTAAWFDYPGLGLSPDAVVVTGNLFSDPGFALGTKIRVYDKAELYDGDATATFVDIDTTLALGGFTLQPAHHLSSPPSGTFYLLTRWNATTLRVVALTGVPGSPVVNAAFVVTSDQGACVSAATQQGTSKTISNVCPRMMNAVYRSSSLWGTLTGSDTSDSRAVVQWFEVPTNGFPSASPSLRQHGAIDGGSGEHTFMPSISVDSCDSAALTYTQSSTSRFPEMRYTARQDGDPLNTMQAPGVAKTSVNFYDDFGASPERWGDYSSTVIDPANGSFWITHEYAKVAATGAGNNGRWGTWHANFSVPCDLGNSIYLPLVVNNFSPGSGPTATPLPTSTPTPIPDPLVNGDFESGSTGWTEFSQQGWNLILNAGFPGGVSPRSGSWAVWLGGDDDEIAYIEQQVTVPVGMPYLAYWHWIASADSCGNDFGYVRVNGSTVDQYDLCSSQDTGGWVKRVVDLSAFQGQSITLQIRAETNSTNNSNLFVDDVAFQSSPTAPDSPRPGPGGEEFATSKPQELKR